MLITQSIAPVGSSSIFCENLLPGGMTGNLSSHTGIGINNFSIGANATGRMIVFVIATITGGNNVTITNMDWDGHVLTQIGTDIDFTGATGLRLTFARMSLDSDSDNTGTMTINYSGAVGGTAVTAWRVTGLASHTPAASSVDTVLNSNTMNTNVTVPYLGLLIACGIDVNTASASDPITQVDVQENLNTGLLGASYGFRNNFDSGAVTVSFTGNGSATNTQRGIALGAWQ